MLDLITLTRSVQSETQNKTRDSGRMSLSEGRVSVVILPALLPRHLQHINDNTIFYQASVGALDVNTIIMLFLGLKSYFLLKNSL